MKKIFVVFLLVGLILSTASAVSANEGDIESKLVEMGFTSSEISQMSNLLKKVLLETYERYDGTSRVLPSDGGLTLFNEDNIEIIMLAGNVGSCQSGYKCKGISVIGEIKTGLFDDMIKQPLVGAAWADNWNWFDYEAEVEWGDFWGINHTEDMTLIDAVPETGLSFKHPDVGYSVTEAVVEMHIDIRRDADDGTGQTDIVGKVGYAYDDTIVGATIGSSPSITFTPTTKVYQVADTSTVYY